MSGVEKSIENLETKIGLCQHLYARKGLFVTGIDVLDRKLGMFSKKKKYLFLGSRKDCLAALYRTIIMNTKMIYHENVIDKVLYFKHFNDFEIRDNDSILKNFKLDFDVIICLEASEKDHYFNTGFHFFKKSKWYFRIIDRTDQLCFGVLDLNPLNRNKTKAERSKEKRRRLLEEFERRRMKNT